MKKVTSFIVIISMVCTMFFVGTFVPVQATSLTYFPEGLASSVISTVNVSDGLLVGGGNAQLYKNDSKYVEINSATVGGVETATLWSELTLKSNKMNTKTIHIDTNIKTSASTTMEILLWNYNTSVWESVKSSTIGTTDTDTIYFTSDSSAIDKYISSTGTIKLKISMTNSATFTTYLDYINVLYEYLPQTNNYSVSSYEADNAEIEYGTVSANTAAKLTQRDKIYYGVSSASNKAAWTSVVTLNQYPNEIDTLVINFSRKYSTSCNKEWFSLWNYQTGNWQVISDAEADTTTQNIRWATSDPNTINEFVSPYGIVKLRIYNSGTSTFTRDADYLNVTTYYHSGNSIKSYAPDLVSMDYGTISGGNTSSLMSLDGDALITNSDANNKCAWIGETTIDINKDTVKSLTVLAKVKTSTTNINNMYFSLYNFQTNTYTSFKAQDAAVNDENIIFTITDGEELGRYISPTGQIKARLYNSASGAFTRTTELLSFLVEYGAVTAFEFAQISDVHELVGHTNMLAAIDDINNYTNVDFTVSTGDVTDHGVPAEFDAYAADLPLFTKPIYSMPGNHDVRWWNANGKNDYENKVGPLYQSFDYNGVHFVLLDSTATWNLDAHFSKQMLQWLENDLASVGTETPILLFAHHPFVISGNHAGRKALTDILRGYNAVAFISGHLHRWGYENENGMLWEFTGQIKDKDEYARIKVTPSKIYLYRRNYKTHSEYLFATASMLPIHNKPETTTTVNTNVQANGNVNLSVNVNTQIYDISKVEARIDNYGPWTTLTWDGATNAWTGSIDISTYQPTLPHGKHFVQVVIDDVQGNKWKNYKEYEWAGGTVSTKWEFQTGDAIQAPPTYYNGVVYVGSEDGKIYAIDDNTGNMLWSYATGDEIISSPAIHERAGLNPLVLVGSNDKKLYALDAITGAYVWSYTTSGSVITNPLVHNDVVYFGSGDMNVYAVNADNGSLIWQRLTEGLMRQTPIVVGDKLYAFIRDMGTFYALNISDGSIYWQGNAGGDVSSFVCADIPPVYAGNKLWGIAPFNFCNIDPTTGNILWTESLPDEFSSRGAATDGSKVYVASRDRIVYAFDAATNNTVWSKNLKYSTSTSDMQAYQIDTSLVCENGIVYHVAERGRITALDAATGNILWIYDAVGFPERVLWSTPEVHNGTVYVGGMDGKVYAIH